MKNKLINLAITVLVGLGVLDSFAAKVSSKHCNPKKGDDHTIVLQNETGRSLDIRATYPGTKTVIDTTLSSKSCSKVPFFYLVVKKPSLGTELIKYAKISVKNTKPVVQVKGFEWYKLYAKLKMYKALGKQKEYTQLYDQLYPVGYQYDNWVNLSKNLRLHEILTSYYDSFKVDTKTGEVIADRTITFKNSTYKVEVSDGKNKISETYPVRGSDVLKNRVPLVKRKK